jgi:hypothetical protein
MDIKKTLLLILLSVISIISLRVMGEDDQSHQNIVILTNQTFEEHLWKDIAAHSKTDRIILFDQFTKELPLDQVHSLTLMFPFYKSKEEFSELWHHFIYVLSSTQQTPKKLEMLNLQWVNIINSGHGLDVGTSLRLLITRLGRHRCYLRWVIYFLRRMKPKYQDGLIMKRLHLRDLWDFLSMIRHVLL